MKTFFSIKISHIIFISTYNILDKNSNNIDLLCLDNKKFDKIIFLSQIYVFIGNIYLIIKTNFFQKILIISKKVFKIYFLIKYYTYII